ncbi:acetyl-CoA synthetase [Nonomuraea typhae]|uniref:acetyl-CoA synthetase n=1 Tax=Nonomuraea typhae TaxID=2603600 RepID=UPI0012FC32C6|nr:acetyl-CoA synthetase [Nonomuraea typhae]
MDPRTPCLVGAAQLTVRSQPGPEPLDLWEHVAREAAREAGLAPSRLDSIGLVYTDSWQYDAPPYRLAERLGAAPRHGVYSRVSGTAPQLLIGEAARRIAAGEMDSALVAGAEALATRRHYRKAGEHVAWSHPAHPKPPYGWDRPPHPAELAHELFLPVHTYPILETARRYSRESGGKTGKNGINREMSERAVFMAGMSQVAAANPHAWYREELTPDDLLGGRFVGWPYTSNTVATLEVDQAAAVILVSSALADSLGVPREGRVYLRGWAYAEDTWEVAARPSLASSPAVAAAARAAFDRAGLSLDDMAALDLYSCFAIAVRMACDALNLDLADRRGVTVTGGLPYAGGPASNYVLHSTATMAGLLRAQGGHGLVTGVGMHMTKHAYAVWSTEPGGTGDVGSAPVYAAAPVPLREVYAGPATVAGYTVAHGRDGAPERAILVADVPGGARAHAVVRRADLLADAESRELVGQPVTLRTEGHVNVADW